MRVLQGPSNSVAQLPAACLLPAADRYRDGSKVRPSGEGARTVRKVARAKPLKP